MNTKLLTLLTIVSIGTAAGTATAANKSTESTKATTVEFLEPERFTDFRSSQFGGASEQASLASELRREIERISQRELPPGYHLALRFRDIDMAGEFEPWRGPRLDDVRIVRDIYPPRAELEYAITNDAGEVIASGERKLIDTNHNWRVRMSTQDRLVREVDMLADFIREIVRPLA